ncbi:glycosyltransferase [Terrisporobacter petrolearius]|uniref:glycosyltransferase n=1 Tax=Terrisporobacter petrolearius TaxID=1460447 RepID=UPI001D1683E8|nr:glycosyltransferase [Terrisporobacter petrolearius]MCC3862741.1 glycosyltransferase [Terrisporobacter petrolearius]
MNIGYINKNYPEKRNIINKSKYINYIYDSRENNMYFYVDRFQKLLYQLKIGKETINYRFRHKSIIYNKSIDLYHFFNHIEMADKDYIVTFESSIPRIDKVLDITRNKDFLSGNIDDKTRLYIEKLMKKLADYNCKKIIAISECTSEIQLHLLSFCSQEIQDKVRNKMVVIHPPQDLIVKNNEEKEKYLSDEITFMFVGRFFHGKGGYEITKAFEKISARYENIKLILVGDVNQNLDYVKKLEKSEVEEVKEIINNNSKISYYERLDNAKVIDLMKKSDVGLLPTWADTYGYSVLEFQACGCPVISSNARALPEINNNEIGWMINMPLTKLKEIDYINEENIKVIREKFISSLEDIFLECIENRSIIKEKAKLCIERVKKQHNPIDFEEKITNIYKSL